MSRESIVIVLGVLVIVIPSLGIPTDWKHYLLVGTGVLLVLLGYLLRRAAYWRQLDQGNGQRGTDTFLENQQPHLDTAVEADD